MYDRAYVPSCDYSIPRLMHNKVLLPSILRGRGIRMGQSSQWLSTQCTEPNPLDQWVEQRQQVDLDGR